MVQTVRGCLSPGEPPPVDAPTHLPLGACETAVAIGASRARRTSSVCGRRPAPPAPRAGGQRQMPCRSATRACARAGDHAAARRPTEESTLSADAGGSRCRPARLARRGGPGEAAECRCGPATPCCGATACGAARSGAGARGRPCQPQSPRPAESIRRPALGSRRPRRAALASALDFAPFTCILCALLLAAGECLPPSGASALPCSGCLAAAARCCGSGMHSIAAPFTGAHGRRCRAGSRCAATARAQDLCRRPELSGCASLRRQLADSPGAGRSFVQSCSPQQWTWTWRLYGHRRRRWVQHVQQRLPLPVFMWRILTPLGGRHAVSVLLPCSRWPSCGRLGCHGSF